MKHLSYNQCRDIIVSHSADVAVILRSHVAMEWFFFYTRFKGSKTIQNPVDMVIKNELYWWILLTNKAHLFAPMNIG